MTTYSMRQLKMTINLLCLSATPLVRTEVSQTERLPNLKWCNLHNNHRGMKPFQGRRVDSAGAQPRSCSGPKALPRV